MDIKSITSQIMQVESFRSPAGASPVRRTALANISSADGNEPPRISAPQVQSSLTDGNYVQEQIKMIMYSFPPFFPAGSPQRIDLIKGIKGAQEDIKKSPLPTEVKDRLAGQNLTDAATDGEISAALKGVQQYREQHSARPSLPTGNNQPVKIVSIKI